MPPVSQTLLLTVPRRVAGGEVAQRLNETVLGWSVEVGGFAVGIYLLFR